MKPWQRRALRLSILSLALAAFALALVQPSQAGTQEAPEIQDPANDQELLGEAPACAPSLPQAGTQCAGAARIDAVTVWIDGETATSFNVNIMTTGDPGGATSATSTYEFHATFAGTEVVSVVTATGGPTISPPAPTSNVASVTVSGKTLTMTILKSVYGAPASGQPLTNLFYLGKSNFPAPAPGLPMGANFGTDRAPNTGSGTDYIFTGGSGGNSTVPGDSDNDQLNDTCELEFYDDLNGTNNATADDDGDGLTNGQECASNPRTDPTKADSDGDGVNDKDDPFPTDATKGGTSSGSGSTSSTRSSSSSTGSSSSSAGTGTDDDAGGDQDEADGEVKSLGDAVERLQSDLDYLGTSAGGMVAVLILAILALAVRWSL